MFLVRKKGEADPGETERMPFFRSRRSLTTSRYGTDRTDGSIQIRSHGGRSCYYIVWLYSSRWVIEDCRDQLVAFTSTLVAKAEYRSRIEIDIGMADVGPFNEVCLEDALPKPPEPPIPDLIMRRVELILNGPFERALFVGIVEPSLNFNLWDTGTVFPPLFEDVFEEEPYRRRELSDCHVSPRLRFLKNQARISGTPAHLDRRRANFMSRVEYLISSGHNPWTGVRVAYIDESAHRFFIELLNQFPDIELNDFVEAGGEKEETAVSGSDKKQVILFVHDPYAERSTHLIHTLRPHMIIAHTCAAAWTPDGKLTSRLNLGDPRVRLMQRNMLHAEVWTFA